MASTIRQVVVADPGTMAEVIVPTQLLQGGSPNRFYLTSLTATQAGNTLATFGVLANGTGITITQVSDPVNGNWTAIDSVANGNVNLVSYYFPDAASVPAGDIGLASSGGSTAALLDNNKSWTVNQWAGAAFIDVTTGQTSTVVSNTSNTLVLSPALTTAPAFDDVYVVGGFIQFNTSASAASYTAAAFWELAGIVTSSPLAGHNSNVQTVASVGTDNITSGTAAMGSSPIMMLSLSLTDNGVTAPNAGSADTSDGAVWEFNFGSAIARLQHQNVSNPGTLAALFSAATTSQEYLTLMMGFKDASSAAALAGGAAVSVTDAGALSTGIKLAGTPAVSSSVTDALSTGIPLAGAPSVGASATGALTTGDKLAGTPAVGVAATGSLAGVTPALAGAPAVGAAAAGALTTGVQLTAAPAVSAAVAAALGTGIPLSALASAALTVAGTLTSGDITYGAHGTNQGAFGTTASVTVTTQAIHSTFVVVGWGNSAVTISDTINGLASGNTWTTPPGGSITYNSPFGFSVLGYVQNGNGGASHTLTVTQASAGAGPAIAFIEVIGAALTGGPDSFNASELTGSVAAVTGPLITTVANRAAVATFMGGGANGNTAAATSANGVIIDAVATDATFAVVADSLYIEPTPGTPTSDTLSFGGQTFYDYAGFTIAFAPRISAPAALAGNATVSAAITDALTTGIALAGAVTAAVTASANPEAIASHPAVTAMGAASLTTGDQLAGVAHTDLEAAALFAGRYRPSRVEIAIYDASSDGLFWGRYPLGNKPASMVGPATVSAAVSGALNTGISLRAAAVAALAAAATLSGGSSGAALAGAPAIGIAASATLGSVGGAVPGQALATVLYASGSPGHCYSTCQIPSGTLTGFAGQLSPGGQMGTAVLITNPTGGITARVDYHNVTGAQTAIMWATSANGPGLASPASNSVTPAAFTDLFLGANCATIGYGGSYPAAMSPLWRNNYFDFANLRNVTPGEASQSGSFVPAVNAPAAPTGFGTISDFLEVTPQGSTGFAVLLSIQQDNPAAGNNGAFDISPYTGGYLNFLMFKPAGTGATGNSITTLECTVNFEGVLTGVAGSVLTDAYQNLGTLNPAISAVFDHNTGAGVALSSNTATTLTVSGGTFNSADHYDAQWGDVVYGTNPSELATYVTGQTSGTSTPGTFVLGVWNIIRIPLSVLGIVSQNNNLFYKVGISAPTPSPTSIFYLCFPCFSVS